jgi:hypothetical protein
MYTDEGCSNTIRQIFIYATGVFRITLLRSGGTPAQRTFIITTTVASDLAAKAITNAVNDPAYVKSHMMN